MKRLSLSEHYVSFLIGTSLSLIQCFIPRFPFNGKKSADFSEQSSWHILSVMLVLLETSGRLLMSLATMIKKFQIFNFVNFSSFCLKFPSCHFNICFTENLLFTLTSCSRQMEKRFCNFLCSGIQAFCWNAHCSSYVNVWMSSPRRKFVC